MSIKTRRKPVKGDTIRILPPFGDSYETKVGCLLATMFTVYAKRAKAPVFLYYDVMKGPNWEFIE